MTTDEFSKDDSWEDVAMNYAARVEEMTSTLPENPEKEDDLLEGGVTSKDDFLEDGEDDHSTWGTQEDHEGFMDQTLTFILTLDDSRAGHDTPTRGCCQDAGVIPDIDSPPTKLVGEGNISPVIGLNEATALSIGGDGQSNELRDGGPFDGSVEHTGGGDEMTAESHRGDADADAMADGDDGDSGGPGVKSLLGGSPAPSGGERCQLQTGKAIDFLLSFL